MKTAALFLLALLAVYTPQMAAMAPSLTSQGMSLLKQQEAASRQAALQQQMQQNQMQMELLREQRANQTE